MIFKKVTCKCGAVWEAVEDEEDEDPALDSHEWLCMDCIKSLAVTVQEAWSAMHTAGTKVTDPISPEPQSEAEHAAWLSKYEKLNLGSGE